MRQALDAEVIVVRGGPAGAATAWLLAKESVDVLARDRAKFPRDKICAEYLSPRASRILSDMKVLDEIESTSPRISPGCGSGSRKREAKKQY